MLSFFFFFLKKPGVRPGDSDVYTRTFTFFFLFFSFHRFLLFPFHYYTYTVGSKQKGGKKKKRRIRRQQMIHPTPPAPVARRSILSPALSARRSERESRCCCCSPVCFHHHPSPVGNKIHRHSSSSFRAERRKARLHHLRTHNYARLYKVQSHCRNEKKKTRGKVNNRVEIPVNVGELEQMNCNLFDRRRRLFSEKEEQDSIKSLLLS